MNLKTVSVKAAGRLRSFLRFPAKTPASGTESKPAEPAIPAEPAEIKK